MSNPLFFDSLAAWRAWLEQNHDRESALTVGFYKKSTGKQPFTYDEAVDEALCFGWIDGVRYSLGDDAYTGRFSPRRKGSYWSQVNIKRMEGLIAAGRAHEAGIRVFEQRDRSRNGEYSSERDSLGFTPEQEQQFKANPAAWDYWNAQPPSYRKGATHWVTSAKREETRQSRLETLIEDCANGRRIKPLTPPSKRKA